MAERINEAIVNILHNVIELLGQDDILHFYGIREQWCNLVNREPSNAAAYLRYQELHFLMLFGKCDELIHVWLDSFHTTLHGWDGITLTLQSNALTPYCAKAIIGQSCSTASMRSCQITAKDKYLIRF